MVEVIIITIEIITCFREREGSVVEADFVQLSYNKALEVYSKMSEDKLC